MSVLTDVGLILASVATTSAGSTGWRLVYREFQPSPMPTRQVCVALTGGFQSEERASIERPTFQIRVRGSTGEAAALESKVQAVIDALRFYDGTPSDRYIPNILMQGDRLYLGRDEHQQPVYSVNFAMTRSITS